MGCNMFFNAKSVALADDAKLKNSWLIGFELRSDIESWPGTIHLEQTFLGPIPQTEHKMGAIYQKKWVVICFSMPNRPLSLMMIICRISG